MLGITYGLVRQQYAEDEKCLRLEGSYTFRNGFKKSLEPEICWLRWNRDAPLYHLGFGPKAVVIYLMELDSGNGGTVCKIHSLFRANVEGT